ncbi:MAG: DUF4190 domain-containing protein [Pyrinomonadaceae bacterium]|nr:DUF4190 domain-containing protein [Phycisphaerales bacterium]
MSQNPFSPTSHQSYQPQNLPQGPQRTSGLAIASLICSLIVCLPGLGVIGLILGVIAFMVIGGSNGRLKGRGLAMAGIILGLVVSVVWTVGIIVSFRMNVGQQTYVQEPTYAAFTQLDTGDVSGFRALLTPALAGAITDEEILAFRDAYKDKAGNFQGQPRDFKSAMAVIGVLSDGMVLSKLQQAANAKGVMPLPAGFSKHSGAIVLASDAITGQMDYAMATPKFVGTVVDIAIAATDQPVIYLSDFIGKKPAAAPDTKPAPPAGNGG